MELTMNSVGVILLPALFIWHLNIGGITAVPGKNRKNVVAKWLLDFKRKG
jgi:hypothetical protein